MNGNRKTTVLNLLVVAILLFAVPVSVGAIEWHRETLSNTWVSEPGDVYGNNTRFAVSTVYPSASVLNGGYYVHYNESDDRTENPIVFYDASVLNTSYHEILLSANDTTDSATYANFVILRFNVSASSLLTDSAFHFSLMLDAEKTVHPCLYYRTPDVRRCLQVIDIGAMDSVNNTVEYDLDPLTVMRLNNDYPGGYFALYIYRGSKTDNLVVGDTIKISMEFQHKRGTAGLLPMESVAALFGGALFVLGLAITPYFNPFDRAGHIVYIPHHRKSTSRKKTSRSHRVKGHARYNRTRRR